MPPAALLGGVEPTFGTFPLEHPKLRTLVYTVWCFARL
jgi:hypothetical protein